MPTGAANTSIKQAMALHKAGQLAAAEQMYRQILAADPKDAEAWHGLGILAYQVGQSDRSVECIDRAISISPNVSAYHNNLGAAHRVLGHLDQAARCFQRAVQLNPDYAEAHINLGNAHKSQGRLDEAAACQERAGQITQARSHSAAEKGEKLTTIPLQPMAELDRKIEQAINEFPNVNEKEARAVCLAAFIANQRHARAHVLIGMLDAAAGQVSMAERAFRTALQIDPACGVATRMLAELDQLHRRDLAAPYLATFFADRLLHMEYPRYIGLETMGHCQAHCTFCPHGTLGRETTRMSDELFEKILHDLREFPATQPFGINFCGVNEPLLDPHAIERLAAINQAAPQARIFIFTNFNHVTEKIFEGFRTIQNLASINISLNAANPEEYRARMCLDLEKTVRNIKRFLTENRSHHALKSPMCLSRVADHTERDRQFVAECHALFSEFEFNREYTIRVKNRTNWLGSTSEEQSPIPYTMPCGAWLEINIYCDGTVPHCCVDAHGRYAIGNVKNASILEIYNSRPFKNLREKHVSREAAFPCNTCSLLQ